MSRMWSLGSSYVMAGNEDDHMRKLLKCDEPAHEYSFDARKPFTFTDGILVQAEGKSGWAVTDTARKRQLATIEVAAGKIGTPGIIRLDEARILLHAAAENEVILKEIDRQSGKVTAEASLPGLAGGHDVRAVSRGSALLVHDAGGLHAFVADPSPPPPVPVSEPGPGTPRL